MRLVLASQSPRRKELMGFFNMPFDVRVADIDETMDPGEDPRREVARVSRRKAEAVSRQPGEVVIAADTIVVLENQILGKPRSEEEACAMLRSLSGRQHTVMTAFCLWKDGAADTHVEKTHVRFRSLSDEEIAAYVATGSPMDKAGAYGIQDQAAIFVEALDGDYYNVMGLPLCSLVQMLRNKGVKVLDRTKASP